MYLNYNLGTFTQILDIKTVMSANGCNYYYKAHGAPSWILIYSRAAAGPANVAAVELTLYDYSGSFSNTQIAADSINLDLPRTGSITGRIIYGSVSEEFDPTKIGVNIHLFKNGQPFRERTITMPEDGNFIFVNLNPDVYQVVIDAHGWLRMQKSVTVTGGTFNLGDFNLKNGDLDGDNEITIIDLSLMCSNLRDMGDPYPGTELSLETWPQHCQDILANAQLVMGEFPNISKKVSFDLQTLSEEDMGTYIRRKIAYTVEQGDRVKAYVLIPKNLSGKVPAVLCLHQTNWSKGKNEPVGIEGMIYTYYAKELTQRGYVTLSPDYAEFGEHIIDPYSLGYVSATMKGIWDHMRAVDILESLPEVDANHIGCIGHSLGGNNAVFVAAFDPRIKALVVSGGLGSFGKYWTGDISNWSNQYYMPRIASLYGCDRKSMPFDMPELVQVIAPRPVFLNSPEYDEYFSGPMARACAAAAREAYALYGAEDDLILMQPDCTHSFPPEVREAAYLFFDRVLKGIN
jgi:hypothetical protein